MGPGVEAALKERTSFADNNFEKLVARRDSLIAGLWVLIEGPFNVYVYRQTASAESTKAGPRL